MRRVVPGWVGFGLAACVAGQVEAQLIPAPCGCQHQRRIQQVQPHMVPMTPVVPMASTFNPCGTPHPCGLIVPQPVVQMQPVYQTQLRPVVQTQLQPQQVTTYRDVPTIQYRQEQIAVQVPVTTMQQVTRDEGSYQMVWVPNLVTRQVPQTTYQTQIGYRAVPQMVTQRVAQVETRLIPQQTVQYIPETRPFGMACHPLGTYHTAFLPTDEAARLTIPQGQVPMTIPAAPPVQSIPQATPQQQLVPTPPPETSQYEHTEWQRIQPRHAQVPTEPTTSMIPSAASAWQAQPASWSVQR